MTIQDFIKKGDIESALKVLAQIDENSAIGLSARYNNLKRNRMLGIISYEDASIEQNRIVSSLLHFSGNQHSFIQPQQNDFPKNEQSGLLQIIAENKRRRPDIAQRAQQILNDLRDYNDQKVENPSYDISGRRLKQIKQAEKDLQNELDEEKLDSLENIVNRINGLLLETIPPYQNLSEAYKLASGRGMRDTWIEQQLSLMPDDIEVKITIAERIETFAANIPKR